MSVPNSQDLTYRIIMEAEQAIAALSTLDRLGASVDTRIKTIGDAALNFGEKWGMSGSAAVSILKQADAEMSTVSDRSVVFGSVGPQAWKDVGSAVKTAENDMNAFEHGIDFIRVALGTLSAMLIFQVVQSIRQTFTEAISYANEYTKALYNVQVAQDILAKSGIAITQKDLLDTATQIEKTYGVFSHVDMVSAVSNAALLTREFGFSKDQISQIVQIAAALSLGPGGGGPTNISNQIEQLTRALTSGTAPAALSKLGVDVKGTSEEVKALELSLYGTTTALTDQQKAAATLQVLYEHMQGPIKEFGSYQDTLPGKVDHLSTSWKNFLTDLGGLFNIIKAVAIPVIDEIVQGWEKGVKIIAGLDAIMLAAIDTLGFFQRTGITSIDELAKHFNDAKQKFYDTLTSGITMPADTATSALDNTATAVKDLSKLNVDSLANSISNFAERAAQLSENLQNQQTDSLNAYLTKSSRSEQDYLISVNNTIQEYNNRRHNIEQTYRNNEKDAEAKFQEQMRQLREKYLFDLEDALRNRDARQVLRLMAQYNMQKTNLTNQFNDEQAARRRQYQQELADAKQQEQQKLQQMAQAEALKQQRMLEDYNTEKAKQQRQYDQQLADLKQSWNDRLLQEAQSLGKQYGLNDSQVQQLYQLLLQYYGPSGYFDKLYDYSYQSLLSRAQALVQAISQIINSVGAELNSVGGPNVSTGHRNTYRASGGIDIVSSPTTTGYGATYGEAGPEAHIFIPLGGSGLIPSLSASGGGGGTGGRATIEVVLSPDLEARITENTLAQGADIITRVMRSK